jgi:hypothetical protein
VQSLLRHGYRVRRDDMGGRMSVLLDGDHVNDVLFPNEGSVYVRRASLYIAWRRNRKRGSQIDIVVIYSLLQRRNLLYANK